MHTLHIVSGDLSSGILKETKKKNNNKKQTNKTKNNDTASILGITTQSPGLPQLLLVLLHYHYNTQLLMQQQNWGLSKTNVTIYHTLSTYTWVTSIEVVFITMKTPLYICVPCH